MKDNENIVSQTLAKLCWNNFRHKRTWNILAVNWFPTTLRTTFWDMSCRVSRLETTNEPNSLVRAHERTFSPYIIRLSRWWQTI